MFIQTEDTPNPETLKFLPGENILKTGSADFPNVESSKVSPLAARLFEVEGVDRKGAEQAFHNASHKLPIKTKIVERRAL